MRRERRLKPSASGERGAASGGVGRGGRTSLVLPIVTAVQLCGALALAFPAAAGAPASPTGAGAGECPFGGFGAALWPAGGPVPVFRVFGGGGGGHAGSRQVLQVRVRFAPSLFRQGLPPPNASVVIW